MIARFSLLCRSRNSRTGFDFAVLTQTKLSPDDFVLWMFPRLFAARVPRYEAIARQYGYTIRADVLAAAHSEAAFLACIGDALRQSAV